MYRLLLVFLLFPDYSSQPDDCSNFSGTCGYYASAFHSFWNAGSQSEEEKAENRFCIGYALI